MSWAPGPTAAVPEAPSSRTAAIRRMSTCRAARAGADRSASRHCLREPARSRWEPSSLRAPRRRRGAGTGGDRALPCAARAYCVGSRVPEAPPTERGVMSAEGNVGAATRVLDEGFNQGRLEVFDEVCSPDVVTHDPAEQEDVRGIEAQKNRCQMYRTAMPDLEVVVEDAFGGGGRDCSRWTAGGSNDGDVMGGA